MRRMSASSIKTGRSLLQSEPREGSGVRRLYDWFLEHPATPIVGWQLKTVYGCRHGCWSMLLETLRDYGLDIRFYRNVIDPNCRKPVPSYWCVGRETEAGEYFDFVAGLVEEGA